MPYVNNQRKKPDAPLVRKKRRLSFNRGETSTFDAPQHTPGVKHTIEGFSPFSYTSRNNRRLLTLEERQAAAGPLRRSTANEQELTARQANKAEKSAYEQKITNFRNTQAARARIKPIIDPEAGEAERRKKAARRRMRGRVGTILSDNSQPLGAKGTLG
jgi:hypothetical protein